MIFLVTLLTVQINQY